MDRKGFHMDKIARPDAASLLSQQVTGARYFFLNLAPPHAGPVALVMGGREHCNPDYAISRRNFAFYGLEYVLAGRGTVALEETGAGAPKLEILLGGASAESEHVTHTITQVQRITPQTTGGRYEGIEIVDGAVHIGRTGNSAGQMARTRAYTWWPTISHRRPLCRSRCRLPCPGAERWN